MAVRRCFSQKIVESEEFYKISPGAQALYLHICMSADDDGFVNNAGMIAGNIAGGKAALKTLVERRFLLQFGSVYVVKHWRVSNSLKNDRLKHLNYPEISKQIYIKSNKAYTDHGMPGDMTLFDLKYGSVQAGNWNPNGIQNGIQMESERNPNGIQMESRTEPNLTEPNLTELNRTEPNRTEPKLTREEILFFKIWDAYPAERRGSLEEAKTAFQANIRTEGDAALAMDKLMRWKCSERWHKDGGQWIPYLSNWINRWTWRTDPPTSYGADVRPSGQLGQAEMEAIQRVLREQVDQEGCR